MAVGGDRNEPIPQVPIDAPRPATGSGAVRAPAAPETSEPSGGGLPDSLLNSELAQERPELIAAGAFVGAFLLARILNRIGG